MISGVFQKQIGQDWGANVWDLGIKKEFGAGPDLEQSILLVISFLNNQQLLRMNFQGFGKQGVHLKSHTQEFFFVVFKGIFQELGQHYRVEALGYEIPPGDHDTVMLLVLIVKFIEEVKEGFKIIDFFFGQFLVFIIQVLFCEATNLNVCYGLINGME